MKLHVVILVAASVLCVSQAWAEEPVGCDKFKWDVTRERAAMTQADAPELASGAGLAEPLPQVVVLKLQSPADVKLPSPPERAPKPGGFAGFGTLNIPENGTYSISLSAAGWIDVLQNGSLLKPKAFSGVTNCEGIRKTMKFGLGVGPAIVQVSGVSEATIKIAIIPLTE